MMPGSQYKSNRDVFLRHDSPEEYLEFIRANNIQRAHSAGGGGRESFLGVPFEEALNTLEYGDISSAAQAEKLIQEMSELQVFAIGRSIVNTQVVGFAPNVPAVLAGHPETMFMRSTIENESHNAPISIYVETMCNAQFSTQDILKRGVSVLAFVMAMNTVRQIDLFAITSTGVDGPGGTRNCGNVVKIPTHPIDLARAAWMLTNNAYNRRIGFCAAAYAGFKFSAHGQILPQTFGDQSSAVYEASIRDVLKLEPTDVLIRGGSAYSDKMVINNPSQWVRGMIAQHNKRIE